MQFNTIGKKIGLGFISIGFILAVSISLTIFQLNKTIIITDRINQLRKPTANASLEMLNGINQSLAALRGWMILGKDRFLIERQETWNGRIKPQIKTLQKLSKNWTNPENVDRLNELEKKLEKFKIFQQEIEDVANTPENLPANKILFENAAPLAQNIATFITQIIELEMTNPNTIQRKGLFKIMSDFRGSMGMALANIRAFLIKEDVRFKKDYEKYWEINSDAFQDLDNAAEFLNPKQLEIFKKLKKAKTKFEKLPAQMFKIRTSPKWNVSQYLLRNNAAPLAKNIKKILGKMSENQQILMDEDLVTNRETLKTLNQLLFFTFLLSILVSTIIGIWLKRKLANPVQIVIDVANQISMGKLDNEIKKTDIHEINLLGNSMREMQENLNALNEGLEEKERRIFSIVNTAMSAMITIDQKGIIENLNQAAQSIFGYSEEEVLGKNVKMLMPSPYKEEHDSYLKKYLDTGNSKIIGVGRELEGKRKTGETFPMFLSISQMETSGGFIFNGVVDDLSELKKTQDAEQKAIEELNFEKIKLQEVDWVKTQLSEIIQSLQGIKEMEEFSSILINKLTPIVEGSLGLFYLNQKTEFGLELRLYASYAYSKRKNVSDRFKLGEGLIGQCALEKKSILLTNIPNDYIQISSGLGKASPKNIAVLPVLHEDNLVAVFEIASFKEFTALQKQLLEQVASGLGIMINNIFHTIKTQQLLEESQRQSEELKAQQVQMQATNQELEKQKNVLNEKNKEVQLKTEELESQQVELQATNEELEKQSEFLEIKNKEVEAKSKQLALSS